MQGVDWAIFIVVVLSTLISAWRGFVKEALSLAAWIMASVVAMTFAPMLAGLITEWIQMPGLRLAIAFFSLFVVTLFLSSLVASLLQHLFKKTGLAGTDRALGMIFGLVRGVLIVSVVVFLLGLTPLREESWWQTSFLIAYVEVGIEWVKSVWPGQGSELLAKFIN